MREAGETQDPNDEGFRLDVVVAASGFKKKDQKALEDYMNAVQKQEKGDGDGMVDSSEAEEEEEEEEEEESDGQEIEGEEEQGREQGLTDEESREDRLSEAEEDLATSHDEAPSTPPPRSRAPSPSASDIARRMESLALSPSRPTTDPFSVPGLQKLSIGSDEDKEGDEDEDEDEEEESEDVSDPNAMDIVKDRVATEIQKRHARQHRKFHSKKSTTRAGRPKGSKAKQDTRVKLDGGGWY